MPYSKEQVAENLRVLRARRNIRQVDVAGVAGVSTVSVSSWESGEQGMTLDNAVKIADFYGISLDELAGRERE